MNFGALGRNNVTSGVAVVGGIRCVARRALLGGAQDAAWKIQGAEPEAWLDLIWNLMLRSCYGVSVLLRSFSIECGSISFRCAVRIGRSGALFRSNYSLHFRGRKVLETFECALSDFRRFLHHLMLLLAYSCTLRYSVVLRHLSHEIVDPTIALSPLPGTGSCTGHAPKDQKACWSEDQNSETKQRNETA